jgi:hypothetical protein
VIEHEKTQTASKIDSLVLRMPPFCWRVRGNPIGISYHKIGKMGAKSSKAKKHSRRRVFSWLKCPVQTSCGKAWAIIRPVLILHCPVYLKLLALCYGSARPLYPEQWFMRSRNHPAKYDHGSSQLVQSLPSGGLLPQLVPPKLLSESELALCFTFQGKPEN